MAKTRTVAGATWRQLTNKTGAASVLGTIIQASQTTDDAFEIAPTDGDEAFGVVAEAGIADGSECWYVTDGVAAILLEDSTAAAHGNWVRTGSTTAGRADATAGSPPGATVQHFQEIGHCVQDVTAGTDKTARCMVHFN